MKNITTSFNNDISDILLFGWYKQFKNKDNWSNWDRGNKYFKDNMPKSDK